MINADQIEEVKMSEYWEKYERVQCRWSQSLGALESTHQEVWGTADHLSWYAPTVFFGLYDLRDYITLWRHRGKAWVLWCGADILNLKDKFIFNNGKLKWLSKLLRGNWWVLPILRKAEHWVENETEREMLESVGIKVSGVCPSFLGDVNKFEVSYKWNKIMNVYVSANEGRQEEYGWGVVERIAKYLPNVRFHLYGATWETKRENVIVHGRVSKKQMNKEISNMQVGLRLCPFDGTSEILVKAILQGQYCICKVKHPLIPSYDNCIDLILELKEISRMKEPNLKVRDWYIKNLNNFPWNEKH